MITWFPEAAPAAAGPLAWLAADPNPATVATALAAAGLLGRDEMAAAALAALGDGREVVRWAPPSPWRGCAPPAPVPRRPPSCWPGPAAPATAPVIFPTSTVT
jgi:hypothetical protein